MKRTYLMTTLLVIGAIVALGCGDLLVAARAEEGPTVKIYAADVGPPISEYIYGQFIEHLGRCIYGGIWAEMLEDRKFFTSVDDKESPWKSLATADSVTMDTAKPFVGKHSPKITAPGGIVQGELGLVREKTYVGRIWLAGDPEAAPVRVSLVWGDGPNDRQTIVVETLGRDYAKMPLSFTAGADTDQGRLEISAEGRGAFRVGTSSLMPDDNIQGMRPDTLALLRELDAPIYRWPGGNFVSGYNWRDGIGDPDRRPPRKNPAWKGIEHNDFGIDEFITFCRTIKTEPLVVVNSGQGTVEQAVEELHYANGSTDTPMGKLRAKNGHPEPYRVVWWGIGNEMYGKWQLGYMPLEKYIEKHNRFAEAMRAVDSAIKLVAVGAVGPWSEGMMQHCAENMDAISEHFYCGDKPDLLAHVRQIPNNIRGKAEAHRAYRKRFVSLSGKNIPIAMDEWNYWHSGPHIYGELGIQYRLKDALGIAAGLNEFVRQSDIIKMANYAQTVNVIGAIKTTKTAAGFATTGIVLKLYRRHFGTLPIRVESKLPLDVAAAWTADQKTLCVAVVNPTPQELNIPLTINNAQLTSSGRCWRIAGNDPMAINEPGKLPKVTIETSDVDVSRGRLTIAAYSVTMLAWPAEMR